MIFHGSIIYQPVLNCWIFLCFLLLNIVLCFGDIHADIVFVLLCNYFHSSFAVEINSKGKVVPV